MSRSATVACKVCGYEAKVDAVAFKSLTILDSQLPMGWTVQTERDFASGQSDIAVYCRDHNPNV